MLQPPIVKQPWEEYDCSVDLGADLAVGETLVLDAVTAINVATSADSTAAVIATSPAPQISGTKVLWRTKDGADTEQHKITGRAHSSLGQKLEFDVLLYIAEE